MKIRALAATLAVIAGAGLAAVAVVPAATAAPVAQHKTDTTQPVPNRYYPWCVTYLPNSDGIRPDQTCYDDPARWNTEIARWTRLGTDFQDTGYNNGSPADHFRLAIVTRRDMDGTHCRLTDHTGIKMQYLPLGWNETTDPGGNHISSFRLDDTGCQQATHFEQYRFGGYGIECGEGAYLGAGRDACFDMGYMNDRTNSEFFSGTQI